MKVWVLMYWDQEESDLCGVFPDRDAAVAAVPQAARTISEEWTLPPDIEVSGEF